MKLVTGLIQRGRGVCPRNRRSSGIPAQFLHQWVDSRNFTCKSKLRSGRVWCASISSNSRSAKLYIETTCGRMRFQQFSRIHFFRELPPEADSDRVLDFDLLIRASSRYFLGNEVLNSKSSDAKNVQHEQQTPPSL